MNNAQIHSTVTEVQRKVTAGEDITAQDVENILAVAAASSRMEHRALYGAVRSRYAAQTPPADDDKPKLITEDEVKAAGEKAKKSSRIEDRVKFAELRRQFERQKQ